MRGGGLANRVVCGSLVFALTLTLSPGRGDVEPVPFLRERGHVCYPFPPGEGTMGLTLCRLVAGTIYALSLEGEGWGEGGRLANRVVCGSLVFALTLTLSPRRGDVEPDPLPQERGQWA